MRAGLYAQHSETKHKRKGKTANGDGDSNAPQRAGGRAATAVLLRSSGRAVRQRAPAHGRTSNASDAPLRGRTSGASDVPLRAGGRAARSCAPADERRPATSYARTSGRRQRAPAHGQSSGRRPPTRGRAAGSSELLRTDRTDRVAAGNLLRADEQPAAVTSCTRTEQRPVSPRANERPAARAPAHGQRWPATSYARRAASGDPACGRADGGSDTSAYCM